MGYKDRSALFEYMQDINSGKSFLYSNMIIDKGQVVGTWKRMLLKNRMIINAEFYGSVDNQNYTDFEQVLRR
jgi:hypothetical protein